MNNNINVDAIACVLAGMVSGDSFDSIAKRLLKKGLSQDQVNDLIERGKSTKKEMYEDFISLKK